MKIDPAVSRIPTQGVVARVSAKTRAIPSGATARALAILTTVAQADSPVLASELALKLKLSKATVHRLAVHLEDLGFLLRQPGSRRFIVGPELQRLSVDALIASSQRGELHAILQALVDEIQETSNFTVLDGNEIVYIDRVESHWPMQIHLHPNSRVPLHCGASGKVFLSFMPPRKRRRLLTAAPLKRYTERTVIDPVKIEDGLKSVRTAKAAIDDEEFLQGLIGLAVPIFDRRGRVCATVSTHVPTSRLRADEAYRYFPAMTRAAEAVTRTLS